MAVQFRRNPSGMLEIAEFFGLPVVAAGWQPAVRVDDTGAALWEPTFCEHAAGQATCSLRDSRSGLEATTELVEMGAGVWRRRDSVRNPGPSRLVLTECLSRFGFGSGVYSLYSQDSRWCHENQGRWEPLTHGERVLRCVHGRTTQGGTPYACLRDEMSSRAVAFHLQPQGNWVVRVRLVQPSGDTLPRVEMRMGVADDDLELVLEPGASLELPVILIQALPDGTPESGAPQLHSVLQDSLPRFGGGPPLVYNTWFDSFDRLDPVRMCSQLAAAKALGCEAFVVDAGWYGRAADGWAFQGQWQEKPDRAFRGRMSVFADTVRAAGLGFGLWMEPEAIQPTAPVALAHPDWFVHGPGGALWPDLENSSALGWVEDEISRLISTYGVVWLKVDFNQAIGPDPRGRELHGYYAQWFALLDRLRERFPETFFEDCASGGLRCDQRALRHSQGHFVSDTVHPIDVLRILQGTLLRLPPGPLYSWAVLRSVGRAIPQYGVSLADAEPRAVTPCGATWTRSETVDPGFAAAVAFPGILGYSGDVAGLNSGQRQTLRAWSDAWKQWRVWMQDAVAHLLTPVSPIEDRGGWVAIQLSRPGDVRALLCVYRLEDPRSEMQVAARGLDSGATYGVRHVLGNDVGTFPGQALVGAGLRVSFPEPCRGGVFVIEKQRDQAC